MATAGAWTYALLLFRGNPIFLGTAILAYALGLRHALDADHIAAIDNITRKLVHEGKTPVATGLLFALGHSTVVVAFIACTSGLVNSYHGPTMHLGDFVGTLISSAFLVMIGASNFMVLGSMLKATRRARHHGDVRLEDSNFLPSPMGILGRLIQSTLRSVSRNWHIYLIGLLFGLGFDTATEVGLLGMSASGMSHTGSLLSIMVFPVMFTAGMSLLDATDGIIMTAAYAWAMSDPIRKFRYNLAITGLCAVVAITVSAIEILTFVVRSGRPEGVFWFCVRTAYEHFGTFGALIALTFIATWLTFVVVGRLRHKPE